MGAAKTGPINRRTFTYGEKFRTIFIWTNKAECVVIDLVNYQAVKKRKEEKEEKEWKRETGNKKKRSRGDEKERKKEMEIEQ